MASEMDNNWTKTKSSRIQLELEWLKLQAHFQLKAIEAEKDFLRKKCELLQQLRNARSRTSHQCITRYHEVCDSRLETRLNATVTVSTDENSSSTSATPVVSTNTVVPNSPACSSKQGKFSSMAQSA